jgi:hypothetical protein
LANNFKPNTKTMALSGRDRIRNQTAINNKIIEQTYIYIYLGLPQRTKKSDGELTRLLEITGITNQVLKP